MTPISGYYFTDRELNLIRVALFTAARALDSSGPAFVRAADTDKAERDANAMRVLGHALAKGRS